MGAAVGKEDDIARSEGDRGVLGGGQPDIVAFLVSDDACWITGQIIDATGGSFLGVNHLGG
jgi:hypothetical protein